MDMISNSSSEIYVQANEKTVESVKEIIDNILVLGGSKLTCDDLFEISINKEQLFKDYGEYTEDCKTAEEFYEHNKDSEYYHSVYLGVKCKDENSGLGKATAKILSHLTNLFEITERHD